MTLWAEGDALRYRGPGESLAKHLPAIKAHKSEILAVLQEAREAEDLLEFFEERAAILEFDAGLPTTDAELEAARMTATLARNRGYQWASLRAALDGYPALSHAGARHARHGGYPAPCGYSNSGGAVWPPRGAAGDVQRGA